MTATQMLHTAATSSPTPHSPQKCWLCGGEGGDIPKSEFVKDTFTDAYYSAAQSGTAWGEQSAITCDLAKNNAIAATQLLSH